jgi:hypothetical protein
VHAGGQSAGSWAGGAAGGWAAGELGHERLEGGGQVAHGRPAWAGCWAAGAGGQLVGRRRLGHGRRRRCRDRTGGGRLLGRLAAAADRDELGEREARERVARRDTSSPVPV